MKKETIKDLKNSLLSCIETDKIGHSITIRFPRERDKLILCKAQAEALTGLIARQIQEWIDNQ